MNVMCRDVNDEIQIAISNVRDKGMSEHMAWRNLPKGERSGRWPRETWKCSILTPILEREVE